jgi:hypothetical protein
MNPTDEVLTATQHANAGLEEIRNKQACQDLFAPAKSAKEQVFDFIKANGRRRTSEVIAFGTSIFCNKADRWARELASEGRIWRVKDMVKLVIAPGTREDFWSVLPADKEFA